MSYTLDTQCFCHSLKQARGQVKRDYHRHNSKFTSKLCTLQHSTNAQNTELNADQAVLIYSGSSCCRYVPRSKQESELQ